MVNNETPTIIDVADTSFLSLDEKTLVAEAAKTLYEMDSDTIIGI